MDVHKQLLFSPSSFHLLVKFFASIHTGMIEYFSYARALLNQTDMYNFEIIGFKKKLKFMEKKRQKFIEIETVKKLPKN